MFRPGAVLLLVLSRKSLLFNPSAGYRLVHKTHESILLAARKDFPCTACR